MWLTTINLRFALATLGVEQLTQGQDRFNVDENLWFTRYIDISGQRVPKLFQ